MILKIIVIRHGETTANKEGRISEDPELTSEGKSQVEKTVEELKKYNIDKIYTSGLKRSRKTAEIIGKNLGVEVKPCKELRECDMGEWKGLPKEEAVVRWKNIWKSSWRKGCLERR